LAEKLARCGHMAEALKIVEGLPEATNRAKVLAGGVDAALVQGPSGKNALPAELHAGFDLIVQAFAQVEAGQDDAARAILQGIGLQSPFLEWKLLLRGLIAYYTNDDARALENWQRLDPQRQPYRLSAVFRAGIDPEFRKAQTPEAQNALQAASARHGNAGLV